MDTAAMRLALSMTRMPVAFAERKFGDDVSDDDGIPDFSPEVTDFESHSNLAEHQSSRIGL